MEDKHKPKQNSSSSDPMDMDSFFDMQSADNVEVEQQENAMEASSVELNGVSSLFEISKIDEDTVNWETLGSFVPVAPKEQQESQQKLINQGLQERQKFAQYTIVEKIGAGGMGLVYKAIDNKLDREVALKVLSHAPSAHSKEILRFRQEAKAIAKLNHPNIVQLYEIGSEPQPYFAMEYVEGQTLKALSKERKLFPRKTAALIKTIAEAIDEVHKQGVIHRDIKPSNIILDKQKNVKILDFGIAKLVNRNDDISRTGDLLGTLMYMSPEQANNEAIDFRTDVYSLGATLYELLTGKAPFEGDSHVSVYYQILHQDPECPRKVNPNVSVELSAITLKCLEKNPEKRYRYMSELVKDLDNYLQNRPISAKPPTTMSALAKFVERNRAFCGVMAGVMCIVFAFISVGYSMHKKMQREQEMHAKNAQQMQKDAQQKLVAKNNKLQEAIAEKNEVVEKQQLLSNKIEKQQQKIADLKTMVKKAKTAKRSTQEIRQLNSELIQAIELKNELIKIAKLQKKEADAKVAVVKKKRNEFDVTDTNVAANKTEKAPEENNTLAQDSAKEKTSRRTNRRRNSGDGDSSTPNNPNNPNTPNEPNNPNNPNNPNDPNSPKKPENPLLVSNGQLKNTFPTGGKNNFPIKAELTSSILSQNGERFLLGYNNGNFVVGNTETTKRNTLRHGSKVVALAIKDDFVLSGGDDGTVKLWDISKIKVQKEGKVAPLALSPIFTLNAHFDAIDYVAFDPEKEVFYTGSESKPLLTWSVGTGDLLDNTFTMNPVIAKQNISEKQEYKFMNYEFDFAKKQLTVVTYIDSNISIWQSPLDAKSIEKIDNVRIRTNNHNIFSCIAICSRTSMIAIGNEDGKIMLLQNGTSKASALVKHNSSIVDIAFSENENTIISSSLDDIQLWKYNVQK